MLVTRKGIQYELTPKKVNYDARLYVKISSKMLEDLHKVAEIKGVPLSRLIRNVMDEYIKNNLK